MELAPVIQYSLWIFLLGVTFTYGEYYDDPNGCAYTGLGRKSCDGAGTSDIADLLGYVFRGKTQFSIAGTCEGFYFLWDMYYKWQQGAQAIVRVEIIYAYILEIPKTNSTERTFLVIQVSDCPRAFELTSNTQGLVPTTELPWSTVYEIISGYCSSTYQAECEIVLASASIYTDSSEIAYPLRLTVSVFISGLRSVLYRELFGGKNDEEPKEVVKKYKLSVEQGTSDSRLYVQKGTPTGPQYACKPPTSQPGIGRVLASLNFDVKSVYKPGGLCAMIKKVARIFASSPSPLLFGYAIYTLIQKPYTHCYQVDGFYSQIALYGIFQSLFTIC